MGKLFKLRYLLPLVQMGLGAVLLVWAESWQRALTERIHGTVGATPPFIVLVGLNFPAALLRTLWLRHVPTPFDEWLLIPAIGALWYWAARNVESWRETGRSLLPRRAAIRRLGDTFLIVFGIFIAFMAFVAFSEVSKAVFVWHVLIQAVFALLWGLSLVLFFGADMRRSFSR